MNFPRYPKYKDSGVAWLDEVPVHWGVGQSRRLFTVRNEGATASDRQLTASQEHGVIYQEDFIRLEGRRVVEVIKGADSLKHVEPNDFVISMRSFQGGIEWSKLRGSISWHYVMLVPVKNVHPPFFAHLFKSLTYIQALRATTDLIRDGQELRYSHFVQVDLPLVPMEEQISIASFLDRETAKIDALVIEQQQLIDLLKEKRQAVISHAVTKGLNPDAPMKPSGVDWLGEVPTHWEFKKLKYVSPELTVGIVLEPSKLYAEEGVPALRSLNVKAGAITLEGLVFITKAGHEIHSKSKLRAGDIVAVRSGQPGTSAVVPQELDGCNCIDLIVIRKPTAGSERFLCWYLGSDPALFQFTVGSGGAIQQHFNISTAAELIVAVPPPADQLRIVAFLDAVTAEIDMLTAEAQRAIELLQERRTALISAAVTGQIDVRAFADRAAA